MYFLEEITKQHQNERLQEAALARILKSTKKSEAPIISTLRDHAGDLLINYGLKLKRHQISNKNAHRPI
jgi:hypothetical protein